jgi:HNH endonuclease
MFSQMLLDVAGYDATNAHLLTPYSFIAEKLCRNMSPDPTTGCWLWELSCRRDGYGRTSVRQKMPDGTSKVRTAACHRVAYETWVGPIPEGLMILHKCDVKRCFNPDHLFPGTHQDNMDDGVAKKRFRGVPQPGEENPKAKLTKPQVDEIRARYSRGLGKKLAAEFGVSQVMICNIAAGRNWIEPEKRKPKAKLKPRLTEEQAAEIQSRYRFGLAAAIGREFGVSDVTVQSIVRGKWKAPGRL